MKKIKVLVLTSSFPRYKNDWWQQAILSIYSNMNLKKYSITVIAPSAPGAKNKENIGGIKVRRFMYFYPSKLQVLTTGEGVLYTSRKKIIGRIQVLTFVLVEFLTVFKTLLKEDFDIIHANWILPQGLIAVFVKFLFRKPVIVTVHGTDIFAIKKFDFIKAFILDHIDLCTANSSATFKAAYEISPRAKIQIVPIGVDIKMFHPQKKDSDWKRSFGKNVKIILGVGRLIKWKGFEYLIKALPRVLSEFPETKLIILGRGPEEENLKKLVDKLHLQLGKDVFFPEHVGAGRLPYIYASSDLVVSPSITIPSTGEKEGLGNVALEARASGTPVIASKSGGLVDTIDGKSNGLLFRERDYKGLSKQIINVFSDKKLERRLSVNGLKLVRSKYSWKIISKRFEKIYEEII